MLTFYVVQGLADGHVVEDHDVLNYSTVGLSLDAYYFDLLARGFLLEIGGSSKRYASISGDG